jgi:hypothetical protein
MYSDCGVTRAYTAVHRNGGGSDLLKAQKGAMRVEFEVARAGVVGRQIGDEDIIGPNGRGLPHHADLGVPLVDASASVGADSDLKRAAYPDGVRDLQDDRIPVKLDERELALATDVVVGEEAAPRVRGENDRAEEPGKRTR